MVFVDDVRFLGGGVTRFSVVTWSINYYRLNYRTIRFIGSKSSRFWHPCWRYQWVLPRDEQAIRLRGRRGDALMEPRKRAPAQPDLTWEWNQWMARALWRLPLLLYYIAPFGCPSRRVLNQLYHHWNYFILKGKTISVSFLVLYLEGSKNFLKWVKWSEWTNGLCVRKIGRAQRRLTYWSHLYHSR